MSAFPAQVLNLENISPPNAWAHFSTRSQTEQPPILTPHPWFSYRDSLVCGYPTNLPITHYFVFYAARCPGATCHVIIKFCMIPILLHLFRFALWSSIQWILLNVLRGLTQNTYPAGVGRRVRSVSVRSCWLAVLGQTHYVLPETQTSEGYNTMFFPSVTVHFRLSLQLHQVLLRVPWHYWFALCLRVLGHHVFLGIVPFTVMKCLYV